MIHKTSVFSLILALIAVALSLFLLMIQFKIFNEAWLPGIPEEKKNKAVYKMSVQIEALQHRVRLLEKELGGITAELDMLRTDLGKNLTVIHKELGKGADTTPIISTQPSSDGEPDESKKSQPEKDITKKDAEPENRYQYLVNLVDKEKEDLQWSAGAKQDIVKAVKDNKVKTSSLENVVCRSTFCRVTINHKEKRSAQRFIENFSELLNWTNSTMEIYYLDPEYTTTDIFVFKGSSG